MRNRTSARTFWILGLALAGAACASDRSLAPAGTVLTDVQVSTDVAVSSGVAAANTLLDQGESLTDMGISPTIITAATLGHVTARPAGDGSPPPATTAPAAAPRPVCTYAASTGHWDCAPFTNQRGLLVTRSFAYFDASGHAMQRYDALATATINYRTLVSGPVGDGTTFAGVTHRTSDQTTSGLLGNESTRVWDGFGVSADTNSHRNGTTVRDYAGVRIDSLRSVTFAHPRAPGAFPLSGQMVQVANFTVTSTGKSSETRSVSRRIVTTFNGTALATIRTGSVTCTLHLDTRKVDGCTAG